MGIALMDGNEKGRIYLCPLCHHVYRSETDRPICPRCGQRYFHQ